MKEHDKISDKSLNAIEIISSPDRVQSNDDINAY